MSRIWSSDEKRIDYIIRLVYSGMLVQTCLSFNAWWQHTGVLPYTPIFDSVLLSESSFFLYPIFLILLSLGIFRPKQQPLKMGVLILATVLILGNIHRFQVWMYLYLVLLMTSFGSPKVSLKNFSWLIAGVYIWSGLHKFNPYFISESFHPLTQDYFKDYEQLGYVAAFMEFAIGVGLLYRPSRRLSLIGVVLMHFILILLLSPLGINWNIVVWYWNFVMILIVILVFGKTSSTRTNEINYASYLVGFVLFLPALNYSSITPEPLSFKMYAGTHPESLFYFSETDKSCFKDLKTTYERIPYAKIKVHRFNLDIQSFKEFNTPLFQYPYLSKKIGKAFCKCLNDTENAGMLYLTVSAFSSEKVDFTHWPCDTLLTDKK